MNNGLLKYILVVTFLSGCCIFAQESSGIDGQGIYKKRCFGCHGHTGDVKAFGVSRKLIELSSSQITERLRELSDKKLHNTSGASGTMHKQITTITKEEYEAVLNYVIASFAKMDVESSIDTTNDTDERQTPVSVDTKSANATSKNTTVTTTANGGASQLRLVVTSNGTNISK